MTIETNYNTNDRILFYSDDYKQELKGRIMAILIEVNLDNSLSIDYEVCSDKIIKSNNKHFISEVASKEKGETYIIRKLK